MKLLKAAELPSNNNENFNTDNSPVFDESMREEHERAYEAYEDRDPHAADEIADEEK